MGYCVLDKGKAEYPFDVTSMSTRTSSKILGCFCYLARKFPHLVLDRFGIIDNNVLASPLPRFTSVSLLDASREQAVRLGARSIAWSGGIDSSFIAAVYKEQGIPFRILYNDQSIVGEAGAVMIEYFTKSGIECILQRNLNDYAGYDDVVTGDGADILFAPSIGDLFIDSPILYKGVRLSIRETLEYVYPQEADLLYDKISLYSKILQKPIDDDIQISRLIQWGCFYYFKRDYFRNITGSDENKMISFFDT